MLISFKKRTNINIVSANYIWKGFGVVVFFTLKAQHRLRFLFYATSLHVYDQTHLYGSELDMITTASVLVSKHRGAQSDM